MIGSAPTADRVVFMFSDIVDSTATWERHGDLMAASLRVHDAIVRECVGRHSGVVFSNPGDGFAVAFGHDDEAVAAALECQEALAAADWDAGPALSVRIGIHAGVAEYRDDNYFGPDVNQAARVCDAAQGGQVLVDMSVVERDRYSVTMLGDYLLKGVSRPVSLLQVGEGDFGPLRALDTRRSNLAFAATELIGRDRQLDDLAGLLAAHRLVTVTGVPGVGKTRVTQAVGVDALPRFADGVWLAELASCRDERSVLSAVAAAVGVPVPDDAHRLAELVRGHDLLLILDNCEHVLAEVADVCEGLLGGSTRLRVLASSRERIGLAGEHIYALDPFISTDHAAQLFRQRAAAAGADVDAFDPSVERQICDQLDRIPLAIELAAATCRVLSPDQILDRLDQRFELLRGAGRAGARGRHETLRSAIDWSYESLDPAQQTFLRRVAQFNGGFGLEGAEHMAVDLGRPALYLLGELVDRSLITVAHRSARSRYDMLETIRLYARDRAAGDGETEELIDRHVEWCRSHIAEQVASAIGSGEAAAIDQLVTETANYRAAVLRLLRRGDVDSAVDLVVSLDDIAYAANPLAELVEPIVSSPTADAHPDRRRMLAVELIRRSTVEGTEGRAELAASMVESLSLEDPGTVQLPVLLIASALGQGADSGYLDELRVRAAASDDVAERARLLVAAVMGRFYAADQPKMHDEIVAALGAARAAELARLMIPIGAAACVGGLSTGDVDTAVQTARPILDLLDDLPTPSIMASGLVVSYTEAAVRAGRPIGDQMAAVRRLGPVLQGDFNRLGLAMARLVQQEGDHELAVRAVGACSRDGRSRFSQAQIEAIIDIARDAIGADGVDRELAAGGRLERSEIYRSMWTMLQPGFAAADAAAQRS